MPSFTDHLNLAIFLEDEAIDVAEESIRMQTIDSQLLGLFEIFGNGIISGWEVSAGTGLSVSISPGEGHINFMSCISEDSVSLSDLPANSTIYVFATSTESTPEDRSVFFTTDTSSDSSDTKILLAQVVTGDSAVSSIDDSDKVNISFLQVIRDEINRHTHRGGASSPSKIDLSSEVRGRLSQSNIADLSASAITTGRLALARIPQLDHDNLKNNGVLTHAQIDSYIKNLQNRNASLFGELSVNNLLQTILALKHIWSAVDEYTVNQISIIPGITSDTFLDESNSTAEIDKIEHTIKGVLAQAKSINFARFKGTVDFENATSQNVTIEDGVASLSLLASESFVEDFDSVTISGKTMPYWSKSVTVINDSSSIESTNLDISQGVFAGKFTSNEDVKLAYTLDLVSKMGTAQDWSNFNQLTLDIKTTSLQHGQLRLSLLVRKANATEDEEIGFFTLLDTNEVTTGFESKTLDIDNLERTQVKALIVYTDSTIGWDPSKDFIFILDNVKVENSVFVNQSGFLRFRFNTPQPSTWSSVSVTADIPDGTSIKIRGRTGNSDNDVSSNSFAAFVNDGEDLGLDSSTYVEIEVALFTDSTEVLTPELSNVVLTYLANSTSTSFTINSAADWDNGEKLTNIDAESVPDEINISSPIRAKEIFYGTRNLIGQINRSGVPSIGLDGASMPMSPKQAASANPGNRINGFSFIADIKRLDNRNFLVSDTFNDRVLILDANGELVTGYVTDSVNTISEFFPLTASINDDFTKLSISFTNATDLTLVDVTKFNINSSVGTVVLSSQDTVTDLFGNAVTSAVPYSSKVIRIALSTTTSAQITEIANVPIYIKISEGGVSQPFDDSTISTSLENTILGLEIFQGNMIYVDGIFNPISAEILDNGNLLIANARPLTSTRSPGFAVNSVLEINEDGEPQGGNNVLSFSVFSLGNIISRDENSYIIAGYDDPLTTASPEFVSLDAPDPFLPTSDSPTSLSGSISSTATTGITELDALLTKRGRIVIIDKTTLRILFNYESPEGLFPSDVQIDGNGLFVVTEKSFITKNAGRVIKLDSDGNVVFQYGFGKITRPNDVRINSAGNLIISV